MKNILIFIRRVVGFCVLILFIAACSFVVFSIGMALFKISLSLEQFWNIYFICLAAAALLYFLALKKEQRVKFYTGFDMFFLLLIVVLIGGLVLFGACSLLFR